MLLEVAMLEGGPIEMGSKMQRLITERPQGRECVSLAAASRSTDYRRIVRVLCIEKDVGSRCTTIKMLQHLKMYEVR